jgi:imidazolonepropionase-like amidohydrolase
VTEHEGVGLVDAQRVLFRNGTVITMDPAIGDLPVGDVLVCGNAIEAVGPDLGELDAEVVDATGKIVIPGFVDTHVGCVSVSRPHDDGGKWPHLGRLEDQVTEVSGPTRDTPGVV